MPKKDNIKEEIQPLAPEIIESTKSKVETNLNIGECLIEVISGENKGNQFKTSVVSFENYFSDESKFKLLKKNQ